ncbi:MAG: 2OG-Fe(II) oxygenase [Alphaproteobacteria bacterium]|nr:2OG-Fe(II) oxygenase [Alphaproteobacteria bacterium]
MTVLMPGDFAPMFTVAAGLDGDFAFDTAGGWRAILCFLGDLSAVDSRTVLDGLGARRQWLTARRTRAFAVSLSAADRNDALVRRCDEAGILAFWDFDGVVARLYGMTGRRGSIVLNENLRFLAALPLDGPASHVDALVRLIGELPEPGTPRTISRQAPVLIVPDVLDPALCRRLIETFEAGTSRESGFMKEAGGRTIGVVDHRRKRRRDVYIDDEGVRADLLQAIGRRIRPEIRKAFATDAMWVERFLVARYDAEDSGGFAAHRDNTTSGTAHRKFAVTINLNTGDYEGGDLAFPEYGRDAYRAPTGGAVVFSCSLMHEALPVTRGRRYAFLPFLYDAAGRERRLASAQSISWQGTDQPAEPSTVKSGS